MKIKSAIRALLLTLSVSGLAAAQQPAISAPAKMPKAAVPRLVGSWTGPVAAGAATRTFVVQFKLDDHGELQGTLTVPESGATLPMADIQLVIP